MKPLIALAAILAGTILTGALMASAYAHPAAGPADTDWPMYQHNVRHSGQSPYLGIATRPIIRWQKQLLQLEACGEDGESMTRGPDGTVYLGVCGDLVAMDPTDGTVKWTFDGVYSRSAPAVDDEGRIYWGYSDHFVALTSTGELEWGWLNLSHNYIFGSSPVIADDGTIYVAHDGLWAFSPSGERLWRVMFVYWYAHSVPAIGPSGDIYVCDSGGRICAYRPGGTQHWQRSLSTRDRSPTVGPDGTIYVGMSPAQLYALDPYHGATRWIFETDEAQYSSSRIGAAPAIGLDGTIYFGTHVSGGHAEYVHIYALRPNGTLKWQYPIPRGSDDLNPGAMGPIVVDRAGNVFACADSGACYGFSPDGELLWDLMIDTNHWNRTAPFLVTDEQMLVMGSHSNVYCLEPATDIIYLPLVFGPGN